MLSWWIVVLSLVTLYYPADSRAQELEPRRWGHLPTGLQYLAVTYAKIDGDIFFDPVLRIEEAKKEQDVLHLRYARSFGLAGRSARIDADALYLSGHWEGLLDSAFAEVDRSGLGDPRLRFSILLHGAPALPPRDFARFRAAHPVNTVVGAAVSLTFPVGEYYRDRLINIGENRFILRPEFGIVHTRQRWSYELTGAVNFYGDNDEFIPGNSRRSQEPLALIQGHIVYSFRQGLWLSLGAGYGFGGVSTIDGDRKDDRHEDHFWNVSLGVPINRTQSVKLSYARLRKNAFVGTDSDGFLMTWSILF